MGSVRAQGYVEVVRGGTSYVSTVGITDAIGQAGGLQAGDVVLIQGLLTAGGLPKAYSTTTTAESFPIAIPAGVTVKARDSVAVHIVAAAGSGVATLFALGGIAGTAPTTRLEKLNLAGAVEAVILQTGGSENLVAVLDKVRFGRNNIGLRATALGGHVQVQVKDCKIMDGVPVQDPVPINRLFSKGLEFRAEDDAGLIEATVDNLSTFGLFPASQMKPVPYSRQNFSHDLRSYADDVTRLIEVFATSGLYGPGEHDDNNPGIVLPVPRVLLAVNGSTLNGAGIQQAAGWDVCVYADTDSTGAQVRDYLSLWDVTMNGCSLSSFKAAGIYGATAVETRGFLRLNQVSITDTGMTASADPSQTHYSGVHLVTEESYIAFEADNAEFSDNRGHGAYLMSASSIQADIEFPTGLYVDLDHCAMHGNSLSGLMLDCAPDKPLWSHNSQGAIVGGTYDTYPSVNQQRSLIWEGNEPDARLPRGQGVVNGCQISNNGEYGVRIRAMGGHNNAAHSVSTRFVNTYVWNNPAGGFYARLEPNQISTTIAPALFTPLVHCTFANNHTGGANGWSAEIHPVDVGSGPPARLFFWDDYPAINDNRVLGTSINNCVFQRASPTDPDFGPWLEFLDQFDDNTPAGSFWIGSFDLIPWAGLRAITTDIVSFGADPQVSTASSTPFIGPIAPSTRLAGQYFLDNLNLSDLRFFKSWHYLRAGFSLAEDTYDIEGFLRPALVNRDKGGEED